MRVIAIFQRDVKMRRLERTHERLIEPGDSMVMKKSSNFMFVSFTLSSSPESTTNITPLDFGYSCMGNTMTKNYTRLLKLKLIKISVPQLNYLHLKNSKPHLASGPPYY